MQFRNQKQVSPEFMLVKSGYDMLKVTFNDLYYLEATGNYVNFVSQDQQISSRMTLAECAELLPPTQFIRIHRSFIINRQAIDKLERHQVTIQGHVLPIAASYRKDFVQLL